MRRTYRRQTGKHMREQQPLWKKFKLLLLFNPLTEWLDTTHLMRLYLHHTAIEEGSIFTSPFSVSLFLETQR